MSAPATETVVRDWRYGNPQAERLCAAMLYLESFQDVDPQHPLGGPDGLKDVRCTKDGKTWVAASYFPPTHPTFKEIQEKFDHDFAGVAANGAQAFAFFVNQPLTIGERENLQARTGGVPAEIYHLERIRALLDSPKGCGVRLEYLRIPMTEAEQWAFWSAMNHDVVRKLSENEARRDAQMRTVQDTLDKILARTNAIGLDLHASPSSLQKAAQGVESLEMPTASFTATTLCWVHRLLTENLNLPEAVRGRFRAVQVWIGGPGSTQETAHYLPPAPESIPKLVDEWLLWWHEKHRALREKEKKEVIVGLAELHHRFLSIHPFIDANGRIARSITDQAARELLNETIGPEFVEDAAGYFAALAAADQGDLTLLANRITAALK
jgi:fido (protein-threonine AMPylation protein)